MEPVVTTFELLVGSVTTFVSSAVNWVGSWATAITSNTLLTLACVAVPLAGFGIGALTRLMSRKA